MIFCKSCAENQFVSSSDVSSQLEKYAKEKNINIKVLKNNPGWYPEEENVLPIVLPEVEAYEPSDDGRSPLANMKEWVKTKCPVCGAEAERETDTMPNWAGSDWYYLAYVFANKINKVGADSAKATSSQSDIVGDIFSASRITSYNVCYTKLLRIRYKE